MVRATVTRRFDADIVWRRGTLDLEVALGASLGEVVAVLGPNGAGKTSLLRAVAGLDDGATGRIELDGRTLLGPAGAVPAERRNIGMMFQEPLLFPYLNVRDNVAFGLRRAGARRAAARAAADDWLARYGLGGLGDRRPSELSGGQAQRVALARALAPRPGLLLLDEPLAALDATTRHEVRRDLRRLLTDHDGATLLVTHDALDAFALADRAVVIEAGRIVQEGTPAELARRPRSAYVADLLGVNVYRGVATAGTVVLDDGSRLVVADAIDRHAVAGDVFVAVRPNAVGVHVARPGGTSRNVWPGRIEAIEPAAGRVRVHVSGTPSIIAEVTPAAVAELALGIGSAVWVSVKATEIDAYPA